MDFEDIDSNYNLFIIIENVYSVSKNVKIDDDGLCRSVAKSE